MTLFARLLFAHLVPVGLVSIALGLTLLALNRMTEILQEVTDVELRSLKQESDIHHASWLVDIALGHAYSACKAGASTERLRSDVVQATSQLRVKLAQVHGLERQLKNMADRWLELAAGVEGDPNCDYVGSDAFRQVRDELDDQLTDLWSRRLAELHAGVASKDAEARSVGKSALQVGGAIAVTAGLLAILLARHLAKSLSAPLAALAMNARRLGAGDFSQTIDIHGPSELRTLAKEFERTRERLAQLEQLKQGFLASISHELRTPLSKLREAISLLEDRVVGELVPEQERVLQIAREACEREIRMVSTLLDLSRLRAGSPIRRQAGRRIDEIIRRAVCEEAAVLSGRRVEVRIDLEGAPPLCRMDVALVERSIANLVRNALAVSQDGQVVSIRRREKNPVDRVGYTIITVSDQGPGVPKDIRDTVFHPFVTSAVPRSPKALGIGLGLALAREVALAHGGDLVLDTTVKTGASFVLFLPLVGVPESRMPLRDASSLLLGVVAE